jgi:hypothetical protein
VPPKAAQAEGLPEGADAPMNQSREALLAARPLYSPEGAFTWTDVGERGKGLPAIGGGGNARGNAMGVARGVSRLGAGPGEAAARWAG